LIKNKSLKMKAHKDLPESSSEQKNYLQRSLKPQKLTMPKRVV
tara:strand:+ start:146 stop:274 length:129 start_codon:yes stop_codon:yes gene_type:complete